MKNYYKKYADVHFGSARNQFAGCTHAVNTVVRGGKALYLTYLNTADEVMGFIGSQSPIDTNLFNGYTERGDELDNGCIERVHQWMNEHSEEERTDKCDVVIELAATDHLVSPASLKQTNAFKKLRALSRAYGMDVYLYHAARA